MKSLHLLIRWSARALSLASIGLLLAFMFGEGFNPFRMTSREVLLCTFFPVGVMVGLGLAWWREALGGALAVGSFGAFYLIHFALSGRFPGGIWFAVFAFPALLFLLVQGLDGKTRGAHRNG